ncbi:MAG: phosphate/phosphite/phosphonate ABC transporter substrate-binding protein [Arcobacter sp.]|uniref:phosphate/phosphite/phosphonate ABC transporter substrate-binding protein n=1 Tax=Arcobacter sp. TaxID=1872629 RepID=UPI003AFFFF6A
MKKIILISLLAIYAIGADITLGVVPQQSPLKLAKKWLKVTEYINKETGLNIIFKTEKSIPKFEEELYNGKYDVAYMNPYHFIIANEKQKYTAFVRAKKNIIGILLAKEEKVEFTKDNLRGKTFLFPAPNAFAATLLTKFELKSKFDFDVDKDTKVLYVNSHDSVYKGISRDIGYLGGGIVRTYNNFLDKNDKDKINVVYKTSAYPSHPLAFHPRVTQETVIKIQQAFISMPEEIKNILSIKDFIITNNKEYDVIKQLGVK